MLCLLRRSSILYQWIKTVKRNRKYISLKRVGHIAYYHAECDETSGGALEHLAKKMIVSKINLNDFIFLMGMLIDCMALSRYVFTSFTFLIKRAWYLAFWLQ